MSPSTLLILGIISVVVGVLAAVFNMGTAARGGRTIASIFIVHGICALLYIGGAISVVTSIVMFLINYAKG